MKGYKVFLPDFTSKHDNFQFQENTEYKHEGKIQICASGFHFCTKASDCFRYYAFSPNNIVCEVEALGETMGHDDDSKVCTNHIRIGKRLTWEEVLFIANEGLHNTGHGNTGYSNTGNRNTGYSNTGNWNTGYRNTGYSNTGNRNTGNWNTGYRNTGNRNTGYSNTGNWNTGNWNTGNWNTGYSNTGYRNTGAFCTGEPLFPMFNKSSNWTAEKFEQSSAYNLLCRVDTKLWVEDYQMTEEEKQANPSYKTCGGYLRDIPFKEAFQNKWNNWSEENKEAFTSLPNFNSEIFFEITGVRI